MHNFCSPSEVVTVELRPRGFFAGRGKRIDAAASHNRAAIHVIEFISRSRSLFALWRLTVLKMRIDVDLGVVSEECDVTSERLLLDGCGHHRQAHCIYLFFQIQLFGHVATSDHGLTWKPSNYH